ncbi:hypothetical protein AOQ84DRAFT_186769 [Glonium stellatum]|uniref:Uncharacterized protein n=1 Tax=Glonium stellatum TaxID=574774 RepID=A0A8E2F6P0_9PEZI|nr:hypothetical protein AOQ84DRAFT_186769 [Glonium stellatum]
MRLPLLPLLPLLPPPCHFQEILPRPLSTLHAGHGLPRLPGPLSPAPRVSSLNRGCGNPVCCRHPPFASPPLIGVTSFPPSRPLSTASLISARDPWLVTFLI